MRKIRLRPAQPSEVKTLQDLNDEVFIDNYQYDRDLDLNWAQSEAGGKKYFTELLNNQDSICIIAEDGDRPIGYLAACPQEVSYRLSKCIEIENMGVIPEYQSFGIGSRLIAECSRIAKERGFQKIYVNAYSKNLKAIKFYKRNEFSEIDLSLEKDL
jgi:diamine N-acetyltransferase